MKRTSKVSLFTMGVLLSAVAARPAVASPVVGWHSQTGVSPVSGWDIDQPDEVGIDGFFPFLPTPAGAGIDEASTAYELTNMNALKALSVNGLGGVAEITADEMDV